MRCSSLVVLVLLVPMAFAYAPEDFAWLSEVGKVLENEPMSGWIQNPIFRTGSQMLWSLVCWMDPEVTREAQNATVNAVMMGGDELNNSNKRRKSSGAADRMDENNAIVVRSTLREPAKSILSLIAYIPMVLEKRCVKLPGTCKITGNGLTCGPYYSC